MKQFRQERPDRISIVIGNICPVVVKWWNVFADSLSLWQFGVVAARKSDGNGVWAADRGV